MPSRRHPVLLALAGIALQEGTRDSVRSKFYRSTPEFVKISPSSYIAHLFGSSFPIRTHNGTIFSIQHFARRSRTISDPPGSFANSAWDCFDVLISCKAP